MSAANQEQAVNCGYFDGHKLSRHQIHFLWIAAIAYAFEMIDSSMFNYATPVLQQNWGLTMEKISTLNSLMYMGMFFGGVFGGWMADRIGRKPGLLLSIFVFSGGSLLTAVCQPDHIMTLELSRFLTGLGVVSMMVIGQVYIAEMMPKENRGKYQAITIATGTIFVPIFTFVSNWILSFGGEAWRWMFIIGAAAILLVPLGIKILKESPRWLVQKGRINEAEKIVEDCIGVKTNLSSHCVDPSRSNVGMRETIQIMFSKAYIKRTLVVLLICWGILIGNTYLMNWMAALMTGIGVPLAAVMLAFSLAQWGVPLGDFVSSLVAEKGGRKGPIVIFTIITGLCYIGIGFVGASIVGFTLLYFLRCIFGNGATTMMWNYTAENFPNAIRSSANGLIMGVGRIVVAASMFTVPLFMNSIGYTGIFVLNGLLFIVPAIIVMLTGTKTANISLEDLEAKEQ